MLNFTTASFGDKRPTKPKPLFGVLRKSNRNKDSKAQIPTPATSWCDSAPKHHLQPTAYFSSVDKPKRKNPRRYSHHRHCTDSRRVSPQFLGGCHHEDAIVARQAALDKLCGRQPAAATMPSPPLSPVSPPRRRTTRRNAPSPLLDSGSSVSSTSSRDHPPSLRRKHSRRPLIPVYTTHNTHHQYHHYHHHYSQTLAPPSPRYHATRLPPSPRSYRNTPLTPPYTQQSMQQNEKADEDDDVPLIHAVSPKSSQSEYLGSTSDHDKNTMLNASLRRSFEDDYTDSENDSSSGYSESESEDEDRVVSLTRQMRSIVVNDRTRLPAIPHQ